MSKNPPLTFLAKVSEFEAAREALNAFRNEHMRLLDQYDQLVNSYNGALKEVKAEYKKSYKDIGSRHGEFHVTVKTDINAKKLLDLMPHAEAAVKIDYKIDRDEYNKLVKAGLIPQEVVSEIETEGSVSVYGPKEA